MTEEKVVSEVKEEEMIEMILEDKIGEIKNVTIEEKITEITEIIEIIEITEIIDIIEIIEIIEITEIIDIIEIIEIIEITEESIKDVITEGMREKKDQVEIMIVITIEKVETIKPEVVIEIKMKNVVVSNKKEDKENQC